MSGKLTFELGLKDGNNNDERKINKSFRNDYGTWTFETDYFDHTLDFELKFVPAVSQTEKALKDLDVTIKLEGQVNGRNKRTMHNLDGKAVHKDSSCYKCFIMSPEMPKKFDDYVVTVEIDASSLANVVVMTKDGKRIPSQTQVLKRSHIFELMIAELRADENSGGVITIGDLSHEVLKELIHFLQFNEIPKLNEMTLELLFAADNYDLPDLAEKCADFLESNAIDQSKVTMKNIAQILILSDKHKIDSLKSIAIKFAVDNRLAVFTSQDMQALKDVGENFYLEVLARCYQQMPEEIRANFRDLDAPAIQKASSLRQE